MVAQRAPKLFRPPRRIQRGHDALLRAVPGGRADRRKGLKTAFEHSASQFARLPMTSVSCPLWDRGKTGKRGVPRAEKVEKRARANKRGIATGSTVSGRMRRFY